MSEWSYFQNRDTKRVKWVTRTPTDLTWGTNLQTACMKSQGEDWTLNWRFAKKKKKNKKNGPGDVLYLSYRNRGQQCPSGIILLLWCNFLLNIDITLRSRVKLRNVLISCFADILRYYIFLRGMWCKYGHMTLKSRYQKGSTLVWSRFMIYYIIYLT